MSERLELDSDATYNGWPNRQTGRRVQSCPPFVVLRDPSCSFGSAQLVLNISGELDLATAPELERVLQPASGKVVIDCRSLGFVDAAGIGVLMGALQHVDSIRLVNAGPRIRRVIALVGLDGRLLGDDG